MQRVQDQDNGINIKFGPGKPRKGDYRLVSQSTDSTKDRCNGTNASGEPSVADDFERGRGDLAPMDRFPRIQETTCFFFFLSVLLHLSPWTTSGGCPAVFSRDHLCFRAYRMKSEGFDRGVSQNLLLQVC